ncbi:MAG TPA: class I SAM-dependent methyltransferase, partial [Rhodanobacteraceae bacterium]|nr:class I SAM-dependent methyltransferase [Rhodanobacteraceae bacterium]
MPSAIGADIRSKWLEIEPWVMSCMADASSRGSSAADSAANAASRLGFFQRGKREIMGTGSRGCAAGGNEGMAETEAALLAEIDRMCRDVEYRRLVLGFCGGIERDAAQARFNATIHPGDPMLLHSLREHRDAGAAFAQYFNIALQQHSAARQLMQAAFGDASDVAVLDFACGYGRLLRFLALSIDPRRIWACDLRTDAVDFVRDAFGVQPL